MIPQAASNDQEHGHRAPLRAWPRPRQQNQGKRRNTRKISRLGPRLSPRAAPTQMTANPDSVPCMAEARFSALPRAPGRVSSGAENSARKTWSLPIGSQLRRLVKTPRWPFQADQLLSPDNDVRSSSSDAIRDYIPGLHNHGPVRRVAPEQATAVALQKGPVREEPVDFPSSAAARCGRDPISMGERPTS